MGITATEFEGGMPALVISRVGKVGGRKPRGFTDRQIGIMYEIVYDSLRRAWPAILEGKVHNAFQTFLPPKIKYYISSLDNRGVSGENHPQYFDWTFEHAGAGSIAFFPADSFLSPPDVSASSRDEYEQILSEQEKYARAYWAVCEQALQTINEWLSRSRVVRHKGVRGAFAELHFSAMVAGHADDLRIVQAGIKSRNAGILTAKCGQLRLFHYQDGAVSPVAVEIPSLCVIAKDAGTLNSALHRAHSAAAYGERHDIPHMVPAKVTVRLSPIKLDRPWPLLLMSAEHPSAAIRQAFAHNFTVLKWDGERPVVDAEVIAKMYREFAAIVKACARRGIRVKVEASVDDEFRTCGMPDDKFRQLQIFFFNNISGRFSAIANRWQRPVAPRPKRKRSRGN